MSVFLLAQQRGDSEMTTLAKRMDENKLQEFMGKMVGDLVIESRSGPSISCTSWGEKTP